MSAQDKIGKLTDAIRYSRNIHKGYANSFGEFACDIWEYLTLSKVALTELRGPDTVDRQLELVAWDSEGFNVIAQGQKAEVVSEGAVALSADGLRGLARDLLSAAATLDGGGVMSSADIEAFNEMCTYVATRRWAQVMDGDRYLVIDRASGESIEVEGRKDQDSFEWARFIAAVFNSFGDKS